MCPSVEREIEMKVTTSRFANLDAVGSSDGEIKRSLSSQSTSQEREGEVVRPIDSSQAVTQKTCHVTLTLTVKKESCHSKLKTQDSGKELTEKNIYSVHWMSYMGKSSS